jgi:D-alanine transaminase
MIDDLPVYLNGEFVAGSRAAVSPDDRGFLFADGAYEVIRSYGGKPFEMDGHLQRLRRSLGELRIDTGPVSGLAGVCHDLLQRRGLTSVDGSIYIQVTRGAYPRAHPFPPAPTSPTVYMSASPCERPIEKQETGMDVILVPEMRWSRCDIKSTSLLPNVLAAQMAVDEGADEALFVRDGYIMEGASSTFCAIFSGSLVTHPESNRILSGITRRVVLDFCRDLGIPVVEKPVAEEKLEKANELIVLSTIKEIMPVITVSGMPVGKGVPGPITRRLQESFRALISSFTGERD